ncbi:MAG: DUF4180 domain-containing protein, partial [Ignavibacteriae bacterium]
MTQMDILLFNAGTFNLLECRSGIEEIEDAKMIIVSCTESRTNRLLLHSQALPPAFFDLRSRFAGEFIQKLMNYRIRVAAVFESEDGYSAK